MIIRYRAFSETIQKANPQAQNPLDAKEDFKKMRKANDKQSVCG